MGARRDPVVTLVKAREKALAPRRLRDEGVDPIEARARRHQGTARRGEGITFRRCADSYVNTHPAGWHDAERAGQWETRSAACRAHGRSAPVQAVDAAFVMKVLEQEASDAPDEGGFPFGRRDSGRRAARGESNRLLIRRGQRLPRRREPGQVARPSRQAAGSQGQGGEGGGSCRAALRCTARLHGSASHRGPRPGPGRGITILTAPRSGEVRGCRWSENDLGEKFGPSQRRA